MNSFHRESTKKLGGTVILLGVALAVAGVLNLFQLWRAASLRAGNVEIAMKGLAEQEEMFRRGYDSGYQSAIVDSYLQKPLYLVNEDSEGAGLWKKVEMDPINQKRVDEFLKNGEEKEENLEKEPGG